MKNDIIKETGATFTPPDLAAFLARKLASNLNGGANEILDPACGDGALLSAIGNEMKNQRKDFLLHGFDINQDYLNKSAALLSKFEKGKVILKKTDFLTETEPDKKQLDLFQTTHSTDIKEPFFDAIIANPPYVRTQIIGSKSAQ